MDTLITCFLAVLILWLKATVSVISSVLNSSVFQQLTPVSVHAVKEGRYFWYPCPLLPIRTENSVKRRSYLIVYSRLHAVSGETAARSYSDVEDRKLALTAAFFKFYFSIYSLMVKCQIIYENRKIGPFLLNSYVRDWNTRLIITAT